MRNAYYACNTHNHNGKHTGFLAGLEKKKMGDGGKAFWNLVKSTPSGLLAIWQKVMNVREDWRGLYLTTVAILEGIP